MSFFQAKKFIVVGASANRDKFGYKVLKWYVDHGLDVVPVNPRTESILGLECAKSVDDVLQGDDGKFGVSIITPPGATLGVLASLPKEKVSGVWLQPGTWDDAVVAAAKKFGNVIYDCILVNGEAKLEAKL